MYGVPIPAFVAIPFYLAAVGRGILALKWAWRAGNTVRMASIVTSLAALTAFYLSVPTVTVAAITLLVSTVLFYIFSTFIPQYDRFYVEYRRRWGYDEAPKHEVLKLAQECRLDVLPPALKLLDGTAYLEAYNDRNNPSGWDPIDKFHRLLLEFEEGSWEGGYVGPNAWRIVCDVAELSFDHPEVELARRLKEGG
ncbi:hypothetical protein [Methanopyrus sp. SNP6]|uniref:hypothetical protein n=1 Tax=Methanopyrus sp. SNP6 TaxID=1937005 RepID=UPI0011E5F72D|nr:hypothetical protein [Methanopyrus sp. SNP6]